MLDRRHDDSWRRDIENELHRLNDKLDRTKDSQEDTNEKLEKNNMMMLEMLEAWDTIKGSMRAIEFLAKALKIIGVLSAGILGIWTTWQQFRGK